MQQTRTDRRRRGARRRLTLTFAALSAGLIAGLGGWAGAQTCTTQAKLSAAERASIGSAAYALAAEVQAGNSAEVQASTIQPFASDFAATSYLIRTVAERARGETLAVSQLYLLDATARKANDPPEADFACPLTATASEVDFGIPGLPPGRYAFATVEAGGARPWLLAFLLQSEGGNWKMAGFYPHERSAAGHDGLWYWTSARADAKANKPWLAWVLYGEADQLLRPATFVSSTNLDKLRTEQHAAAPAPLANGLNAAAPLMLQGAGAASLAVTDLTSQASPDGHGLDLVLHLRADSIADTDAATQRNLAAAKALFTAHPELRGGFDNITVVADATGGNPFIVKRPVSEISGNR